MPRARLIFDGDWVYTEKEARIHKLTQETEIKIDNIPGVVDDVNSTSTTDALSANMGKHLQDQINTMTGLNRFLSTWDCTTGLPMTNPSATPFTYTTWNYYLVGRVADWWTNYKPHWNTFTPWVASEAVETETVNINDMYIFDWSQWILQINKVKEIIIDDGLDPESTNAVENRAIYLALTTKQNNILDLGDIRAGAALWATSIQPWDNITELTNNIGYQTAGDVASAIEDAIDELAPGGVGRWVLTLQKNGVNIDTFSADAHDDKTINIAMTKSDVGLGNVDNTADIDKPISTATQTYVDNAIEDAIDGSKYVWPTAPSNPEEGMLWYDTTNDVLKVYDWSQWNLTWKVYSSWNGIVVDNSTDVISADTNVLATKTYVDDTVADATENSKYVWPTAPSNPTEWMLWYDTTNDVLKVYNWTTWVTIQELLVNGVNIKTVNNHNLLWSWNIDIIWVEEIQFVTQAEYDALPSTKTSDGKAYFIYSWHWAAIVSDEVFWSSWDWITTQAPSKNAVYDKINSITGDVSVIQWNIAAIQWDISNLQTEVDEIWQSIITVKWATLWSFLKACTQNGTLHTIDTWGSITYTMKWIGYVRIHSMYGWRLRINGVEVLNEYYSYWSYTVKYYMGPFTVSKWDIIQVDLNWWGWSVSWTIYDYYDDTIPITAPWIYYSSSQQLVSMSIDWTNWFSIADRDLGWSPDTRWSLYYRGNSWTENWEEEISSKPWYRCLTEADYSRMRTIFSTFYWSTYDFRPLIHMTTSASQYSDTSDNTYYWTSKTTPNWVAIIRNLPSYSSSLPQFETGAEAYISWVSSFPTPRQHPVRPVKNVPVQPTLAWSVIYQPS